MKVVFWVFAVLSLVCITACRDDSSSKIHGPYCELVPRIENIQTNSVRVAFDKLPDDAILVAVNGYPLTKKRFDDLMVLKAKQMADTKDSNIAFINSQLEEFKKSYIRLFANQRIMIDEARRLNLYSDEEMDKAMSDIVSKMAKAKNQSVEEYIKKYPGDFSMMLYETAARLYIDRLVNKCIPPKVEVDTNILEVVRKEIRWRNEALQATNEVIHAQLVAWRKDIADGKITFEELAKTQNQDDYVEEDKPWYWGDFERGMIEEKNIQSVVFSLKAGEISQPVEDDEGFHLLKVYEIQKPQRNEEGRIIQDEVRKVGHILRKKAPLLLEESSEVMTKDLKYQFQIKAINEYLNNLVTNGTAQVVYPYGKDIIK